ncbi:prolyl oligopeptidase family serine peptidase [Shewanella sp. KX20019]|uniref:alpha/beta hydrolase family protein n=1 Tax=Shewanella sp. KX20019 TaxID=2803864 RepID=UPI0019272C89|nr:prolyl oligopeptidase family serine peptidase [Shewanella sp. KX20019]QQX80217.1 prolyl oligopeptidase family serine peptidase [Shewanella sp. KX20019]
MKIILAIFIFVMSFNTYASALERDNKPIVFNHENIIRPKSCFTGVMSSYEGWSKQLIATGKVAKDEFYQRFPQRKYDLYREKVNCYSFIYQVDEHKVRGYLLYPKLSYPSRLPSVIYNRGGNNIPRHTLKFGNLFLTHFPIALEGYVVISSQYGGARVWPPSYKGNTGVDEYGGSEVGDVLALLPILDNLPITDPNKVAMMGWSRGGMMSLISATKSNRINTLILGGTPVDLLSSKTYRPDLERFVFKKLIPNYEENKVEALKKRSAIYWPEKIPKSTSVLMLHGTNDQRVKVDSIRNYVKALENNDVKVELEEYKNGSHTLIEFNNEVLTKVKKWLAQEL